jgi:hypothetical protein
MSSSDIIVGYNKNDFFYVNAENTNGILSASDCTFDVDLHNTIWDTSCNETHFVDNSANCLKKELCINKEYANTIKHMQQNHSGADEKYENAKQVYDQTFARTLNLGGGILVLLMLIYKVTTK